MSQGTRSKVSAHGKHQVDSDTDDTIQLSNEKESSTVISQTNPSLKQTHPAPPTKTGSNILDHQYGSLYPVPQSIKSLQITSYQTGLQTLSNQIFTSPTIMSRWYEDFMSQALLINMHEYFYGQIEFALLPACDALYHLRFASPANPFQMKAVDDNISFLEYTSPTTIENPVQSDYYPTYKEKVYVTKKQLEVVDYITKYTGQFLKTVMNLAGNTTYLRLITTNFKVDVDQPVLMLEAIHRFSITNQKGREVPQLCKKFYSLLPCTFDSGVQFLESVQSDLHRHKYTSFTDEKCDVHQLILMLLPGNIKKNLLDSNRTNHFTWTEMKIEADVIMATLKQAGQPFYDSSAASRATFSTPPKQSGTTVASPSSTPVKSVRH